MGYSSLRACVADLEKHGHLVRIREAIDPNLEIAEIQRRVYSAGGPALLFESVKGSAFPVVTNLFGTPERAQFIFRDTLERVKRVIELRADPTAFWRRPQRYLGAPFAAIRALPRRAGNGPVMASQTTLSALPAVKSWPDDGGPFVTLPQVYSEHPERPGPMNANVGMYRIQIAGNAYTPDAEVGMHYQIHRGIGVHHTAALARGESLPVSVFVGGPPAHTLAAVMPLPEGLSELTFAGMLAGRRFRHIKVGDNRVSADADFCLVGRIEPGATKPEGPFGDHLGYYSLVHDFPVMKVERVYHRRDAIWPATVVGRPPQEDTTFGWLIHELTGPMVPVSLPGLHAMHAVDSAGVHPLLLAIGSERYVPYGERVPRELLTIANSVLGFGQASLAKYLLIAADGDVEGLDVNDESAFLQHIFARFDPTRDLHFQTRTTIDTLDYSGSGLNEGSKVVIAAVGEAKRELATEVPGDLELPGGFSEPRMALPGVMVVQGPKWADAAGGAAQTRALARFFEQSGRFADGSTSVPLVVIVDDAPFAAATLGNFLWVTFTRSNPAVDLDGVGAETVHKHWGCRGALVIDARIKSHHAPPLVEDPDVTARVDSLAAGGGPLHGLF